MICSITKANGSTDYHQWGLNCKELKFTDAQCEDVLNQFNVTDQDLRDEFWNAFVNSRRLVAADFKEFAVYHTQGGGLVKWDQQQLAHVFVTPPAAGINLGVGDFMPEEWGVQPANNVAYDECF